MSIMDRWGMSGRHSKGTPTDTVTWEHATGRCTHGGPKHSASLEPRGRPLDQFPPINPRSEYGMQVQVSLDAISEAARDARESAVRGLRDRDLGADYSAAWDDWAASDDAARWESTVADGLE